MSYSIKFTNKTMEAVAETITAFCNKKPEHEREKVCLMLLMVLGLGEGKGERGRWNWQGNREGREGEE